MRDGVCLCGLPTIESHGGVRLVPLLRDPGTQWKRPAVIGFQKGNAAVRNERYRYIRYHDGGERVMEGQL